MSANWVFDVKLQRIEEWARWIDIWYIRIDVNKTHHQHFLAVSNQTFHDMDPRLSKLEYYKVYNSLACIPFILLHKNTVIDLWNNTSVAGTIQDVDG